jgi:hypothetical protein
MYWLWLNILLAAMFFGAWTGVPLWLVVKHPDTGPDPRVPETDPCQAHASELAEPRAADVPSLMYASDTQPLADARA